MYRLLVAILLVSLVLFVGIPAYAGGAGNCVQPVKTTTKFIGVGGAFEYNYVNQRMNKLENKRGPRDMKIENMNQVYGKAIVGLGDYVNLYGKAGGCNYDLKFKAQTQNATMEIDLDDGIYTGVGINALFPITKIRDISLGVGLDVQANYFQNDVKGIIVSGMTATKVNGSFYGVDGQNSLYLTGRYDIEKWQTSLVPYVGGYHSWIAVGTMKGLTADVRGNYVGRKDYQAAFDVLSFGVLFGIDIDIAKYVNLNVEGRFVGETALTTGATIKF